jgi:hypothetical protein
MRAPVNDQMAQPGQKTQPESRRTSQIDARLIGRTVGTSIFRPHKAGKR